MSDLRADYLAALDATLRGPRRLRRSLVHEVGDHLEDASSAYVDAGLDEGSAVRRAVEDFGTVDEVAPAFQTTLAVSSARRTSLLLLTVLSVQPFIWDNSGEAPPDGWAYAAMDTGVELLGMLMLGFALTAALACGIGNRWFVTGRVAARTTAWGTLGSGAVLALTGIAMTVLADGLDPQHWALLSGFILVPVAVTSTSARRTLATC